ncbi:hypothetical protein OSTOST_24977 [Ostertagia ostertagi]
MYIAFCHIIASRGLLPSSNFKKRTLDDAVDQQYLRELMLVVSPTEHDENDAIEVYCWRMRYDADGEPQAELRQNTALEKASSRVDAQDKIAMQRTIRALHMTASATLGESLIRTAPGFYRSPEDFLLRSDAQEIEIGAMQTNYHGASVVVQSVYIDDAYAAELRLREGMQGDVLNDSLNDSYGDEAGAGDDGNRSDNNDNNDTMERISGTSERQADAVEVPRSEISTRADDSGSRLSSRITESASKRRNDQ